MEYNTELNRCIRDPIYFMEHYITINGKNIVLTPYQKLFLKRINRKSMNLIVKAQFPNRNFRRLYWADNKEQIKEILSRVNIKYLEGLKKKFKKTDKGTNGVRFYIRYDGYEFQVSGITINRELKKRSA